MFRRASGLPRRQRLVGLWLLLSGIGLLGGALFAAWLDNLYQPQGLARLILWLGCFSGGITLFAAGLVLERWLFTPLRHLQGQLARLAANPDVPDVSPPEGWLRGLGPDLERVHAAWRDDRQRLAHAHADGAREATRVRQRLEVLLQTLDTPLLLCDRHHRLLLYNQAAERLFAAHPGLGLGKELGNLLPAKGLVDVMACLPDDGSGREVLIPHDDHWLHVGLRRVSGDETLLTLSDATLTWAREVGPQAELDNLLPALRRHGAGLISSADALAHLRGDDSPELRRRLEAVIDEEGDALGASLERLGTTHDALRRQGERLVPLWSNDLWAALGERLAAPSVTPVGMPAWLKGDAPVLLEVLASLLETLAEHTGLDAFDGELCLGNRRVYLDLCWHGEALAQRHLDTWRHRRLERLPHSPSAEDVLRQHASDVWSLSDGDWARLRLPLPALSRTAAPRPENPPRPEFHDFDIAKLPAPDTDLASRALHDLEIVAFDTETTGLALREGDRLISLGACRIVNGRLLADETFEQHVNPQRPIPSASTAIHGLGDQDVENAPTAEQVLPRFRDYVGSAVLLAHNAAFDMLAIRPGPGTDAFDMPVLDTLLLSRALDPGLEGHDLDSLAKRYGLRFPPGTRHTALGDARVTARLWLALRRRLEARGIERLSDALVFQAGALDREDACAP
ncbi:exonuclease domain-containing protein [Halomonas elongata]|uniref:exonuclease domain-containing protein n=1 Tax=Halomonas elongata TaxID=2746 RepID=UPI002E28AAD0|nr:exonuclease domain-containing protein [Halomonas elongata]WVI73339.1 exonuclease domain-containing protein [Halomonas elongata]